MSARHQQVADDLRRRIRSGTLPVGQRLPPETELAAHYRVSTPTLREALGVLQAEGLVEKFQGRGNFVREPPARLEYPAGTAPDLHITVSFADIPATSGDLALRFGVPPDAGLTEYVYLAHRGETAHSLVRLYVPHAVARIGVPPTGNSPFGDDVLSPLATRAGVPVACETHQVTARFPTDAEAQSLRIASRTPVLAVDRTLLTDDGQVVAYAVVVLPGDRAQVAFAIRSGMEEAAHGR